MTILKKYCTSLFFLLSGFSALSQEIGCSSMHGIGKVEMTDLNKMAFHTGVNISTEWFLQKEGLSLIIQPGYSKIQYDHIDTLCGKYFIGVAILVRKYFSNSARTNFFFEVGPCANYLFWDKKGTVINGDQVVKTKRNIGWNLGIYSLVGVKVRLSSTISFDIGLGASKDLNSDTVNENESIRIDRRVVVFGISKRF